MNERQRQIVANGLMVVGFSSGVVGALVLDPNAMRRDAGMFFTFILISASAITASLYVRAGRTSEEPPGRAHSDRHARHPVATEKDHGAPIPPKVYWGLWAAGLSLLIALQFWFLMMRTR